MVDLMGRPSCAECFDNCLKRSPGRVSATNSPRRPYDSPEPRDKSIGNIGGLRGDRGKSREGSPAIEELEQRLGIIKSRSRESSPALEELSQRLSAVVAVSRTPTKDSPKSRIPVSQRAGGSRDGTPLVDRKVRGRSLLDMSGGAGSPFGSPSIGGSPAYRMKYDRQKSPELDSSSPSQRIYERFKSPELLQEAVPQDTSVGKDDAVEEMKKRFLKHAVSSSSLTSASASSSSSSPSSRRQSSPASAITPQKPSSTSKIPVATSIHGNGSPLASLRSSLGRSSFSSPPYRRDSYGGTEESSVPSTPDMTSDFEDTVTESSAPSSPPERSPPGLTSYKEDVFGSEKRRYVHEEPTTTEDEDEEEDIFSSRKTPTPKLKSRTLPTSLSPNTSCGKCGSALFTTKDEGKFVTVPDIELGAEGEDEGAVPPTRNLTYHTGCFRCTVCQGMFKETGTGQAIFVRGDKGACHPEVSRSLFRYDR